MESSIIDGDADLSDLRTNRTALRLACGDDFDSDDDDEHDAIETGDQECLSSHRSRIGALAVPSRLARRLLAKLKHPRPELGSSRASDGTAASLQHLQTRSRALSFQEGALDQRGHLEVGQDDEESSSQDERERVLGHAAERARSVIEREALAREADIKRAWRDRHHGEIGPERSDYQSHVAPAWLGSLPSLSLACALCLLDVKLLVISCFYACVRARENRGRGIWRRRLCRRAVAEASK